MIDPRFKEGDLVADDLGLIGTIIAVYPGEPFPYSIRESSGGTARHAQTPRMRIADTEPPEAVDHPAHYGGEDNPYEVFKVVEAWGLDKDAYLFNVIKYIARAGKKDTSKLLEDLKKGHAYLERRIKLLEAGQ
jgi:hypothetical protein